MTVLRSEALQATRNIKHVGCLKCVNWSLCEVCVKKI